MIKEVQRILLGKALKSEDIRKEKLNVLWRLTILASNAISSVAYASEENLLDEDMVITIVMPQYEIQKWWYHILHNQTSLLVRTILLRRRHIAIVTIPYIIDE